MKKEKPIIRYFKGVQLKWTQCKYDFNTGKCFNFESIIKEDVLVITDSSKKSFLYVDITTSLIPVRRMNKSTKIFGGEEITVEQYYKELEKNTLI